MEQPPTEPAEPDAPASSPEPHDAPPGVGLTPEQAVQLLGVETAKRRQIATATQSGSRLVTIGLALGVAALGGAWLLPPSLGAAAWVAGGLAAAFGGFGLLRLLAAYLLGRG